MSDKLCIIIDDKDQQRVFDSDVVVPLKREGYYVDGILINTTDPEILDDENNIDMDKLKAKIEEAMNGKSIDIIATDFDLSDEKINGIQGRFDYDYHIYERPDISPHYHKGHAVKGDTLKDTQINTNKQNTKKQIDKKDTHIGFICYT